MIRLVPVMVLVGILLMIGLLFSAAPGVAAPVAQQPPSEQNESLRDEYCLSCHANPGQTYTLPDGSELDLYVDPQEHANSIHGSQGYACVQCHTDVGEYPHPPLQAVDRRDLTLQLNGSCKFCHANEHTKAMDSVHAKALEAGNRDAAVCTDCHTAHAVQDWVDETTGETLPEARTQIPQTCAKCHSEIHDKYAESVHGSALTEENNPDVPTCIDCHGVHNIEDPTTNQFRLSSPEMCANCHTDPARMAKYGISTDVLDTYVADFHGTTVQIFEKQSPDADTNKPVCYDCHGIHDIAASDDPEKGLKVKENLLVTCQKCHPDARDNFPTSWLSHYIPSPDKYPLVYYVNLFYLLLIPVVLGGMFVLVAMDFTRSAINRNQERKLAKKLKQQAAEEESLSEPTRADENTRSENSSLDEREEPAIQQTGEEDGND